ncbi:hypothetical protein [Thiohalorhabdus methylotrophus]|uniref:Uncharacterized protein n=1 Tax=Thiohalorhabdus methylotrophus TaxID=3242694 RepID=A0ABV4TZI9_9GAMM
MTRLLLDISAHGFGHLAQAAPVVNALENRLPELQVMVRADLPERLLRERLQVPFEQHRVQLDPGMAMQDALTVDRKASIRAYAHFHRDWEHRVAEQARRIEALAPDLVLADAPYLSPAAARLAGIPAAVLCSLDWAGVFSAYCGAFPGAAEIHADMIRAYNDACCFLQPVPHMPMSYLSNRREIGPLAERAGNDPATLRTHLGVPAGARLGLVTLGGLPFELAPKGWPRLPGVHWLTPGPAPSRPDFQSLDGLGLNHLAALAACDVVVTKPGYGTLVEAACHGVDVLYLPRGDWPEEPYLLGWLHAHARCREITRDELERGHLAGALEHVARQAPLPRPAPTGAEEGADILLGLLPGMAPG